MAGAALLYLAISAYNWRCPQCRKFTGTKDAYVREGSFWRERRYFKYSCTNCHHQWNVRTGR